jgi:hypothetical protein
MTVVAYSFDFDKVKTQNNNSYTCSNRTAVALITSALATGSTASVTCSRHTFSVFKCSGLVNFCVDCSTTCSTVSSCPSSGQMVLNPCLSCSQQSTGSYFVIGLTYVQQILYPLIVSPLTVTVRKRQFSVSVALQNNTGKLYCAALSTGSTVTSSVTIQQSGTVATVLSLGNVSLVLSNLIPATTYDVYCFTQDFSSSTMPLSSIVSTKVTKTTLCCRSIIFSTLTARLVEATAVSSQTSINVVKLESLPTTGLTLSLSLASYTCSWQYNGTASYAYALPSSGNFSSASTSRSMSFVILGSPGCYVLTAWPRGIDRSLYSSSNATIIIRSSAAAPDPPQLLSAIFSNDGLKVTVTLNSASDRGATRIASYASTFACSQLLTFSGANSSSCIWYSTTVIIATISSSSTTSLVTVGSSVTLQRNKIKAVCPSGLTCGYANASTVTVAAPTSAIVPSVQVITATKIGGCDSIVIDPTGSTGNGGRTWQSVSWSVSGVGAKILAKNVSAIATFLSTSYSSTSGLVTIPNTMLSYGTYTIGLKLKNFLNESGFGQVSVVVSDSLVVPRLSIVGSSSISMYRYQTLSVFANASFPACVTTSVSLVYTWSLFQGSTLQYSITSYAKDQRFYRLAAYKLTSSTSYLLRVSVSVASSPSVSLTTAQVTLNVGASGVSASITGGATQSFGVGSTMALDASGSQDIDYPGSALSYKWSCMEISPNFGNDCKNFSTAVRNSSTLSVASNLLAQKVSQTQLSVTVYVTNSKGYSASASMTAIIQNSLIPVVSIRAAKTIFNVGDAVAVTGLLSSTVPMRTVWTVSDTSVSLSAISSNSKLNRTFTAVGFNAFDLGITANSLVAGLSYTFQLSAQYVGFSASSYAQITITMNTPPSGGSISVAPSVGTALTTAYFMSTTNWVDDASDYPFSYIFSYYTTTSTSSVVVKNLDTKSYSSSVLGQGLQGNNYLVTCVAAVMDVNNGSSSVLTTVTVKPGNVTGSQTAASLATALSNLNPSAVAQIIGATTSSVNAANCSVPVPCWKLHRENCSFTALTCGPCLSGYIGVSGSSNVACFSEDNPPATATCTAANAASVCESGKCDSGVCVEADKTCTSNCSYGVSGNGQCTFYDVNNAVTSSCAQSNSFCRAACVCNEGFYGSDCSLDQAQLESVRTIRDALCVGLYQTLSIQDVSADVINSRATSIANILLDVSQLGEDGFTNCTVALIETIQGDPELAASGTTATLCMEALSTVLQKGPSLSAELVANISSTLAVLSNGIQSSMAVGQQAVELTTTNVRMSTALQTSSDIGTQSFGPPLTAYEKYLKQNTTAIGLNASSSSISSSASVGVAVLQYVSSPNGVSTASKSTGLQVSSFSSSSDARRRLDALAVIDISIDLFNIDPQDYYTESGYNGSYVCEFASAPYNVTVQCGEINEIIWCNGSFPQLINYSCPTVQMIPQCRIWNGVEFEASPDCVVESYSDTSTTCACALLDSELAAESVLFTSVASLTAGVFYWSSTDFPYHNPQNVTDSHVTRSRAAIGITIAILCSVVCVFVGVMSYDLFYKANLRACNGLGHVSNFGDWVRKGLPEVFEIEQPCSVRLWKALCRHHDWMSLMLGDARGTRTTTETWMRCAAWIVHFLFFDTVFVVGFYNDDGCCEGVTDERSCSDVRALYRTAQRCEWNNATNQCSFSESVYGSGTSLFALTTVVICVSVPCQAVFVTLLTQCQVFFSNIIKSSKKSLPCQRIDSEADALTGLNRIQTWQGKMLRAARLTKLQQDTDLLSAAEEVRLVTNKLGSFGVQSLASTATANLVIAARMETAIIASIIRVLDLEKQNRLLFNRFLFKCLEQPNLKIQQYFDGYNGTDEFRDSPRVRPILILFGLLSYIIVIVALTLWLALKVGSKSSVIWVEGIFVTLLESVILLLPLEIFLTWVCLAHGTFRDVKALVDGLIYNNESIMTRCHGIMNVSSRLHHMNSACRVARQFPSLPISRFLLSLHDKDIELVSHDSLLSQLCMILDKLYVTSPAARDIALALTVNGFVGMVLIFLGFIGEYSSVAAVILAFVMFVTIMIVASADYWQYSPPAVMQHDSKEVAVEIEEQEIAYSTSKPKSDVAEDESANSYGQSAHTWPSSQSIQTWRSSRSSLGIEWTKGDVGGGLVYDGRRKLSVQSPVDHFHVVVDEDVAVEESLRFIYESDEDTKVQKTSAPEFAPSLPALLRPNVDCAPSIELLEIYGHSEAVHSIQQNLDRELKVLQRSASRRRWMRATSADPSPQASPLLFRGTPSGRDGSAVVPSKSPPARSSPLQSTPSQSRLLLALQEFGNPSALSPSPPSSRVHKGSQRHVGVTQQDPAKRESPTFRAPDSVLNPVSIFKKSRLSPADVSGNTQPRKSVRHFALREDDDYNEGRASPLPSPTYCKDNIDRSVYDVPFSTPRTELSRQSTSLFYQPTSTSASRLVVNRRPSGLMSFVDTSLPDVGVYSGVRPQAYSSTDLTPRRNVFVAVSQQAEI